MNARIENPAVAVPGALQALQAIANAAKQADIPETTLYLVELRASQINGCGVCVDIHSRQLKHAGEPDARINTVAAWRDVSYFSEAERAALALTEAATRLADCPDPVSDEVWATPRATTTTRSSPRSCSRSPRSTPGIASTSPRGRSAGTGWASGSPQSRRTVRPPDADRPSSRSMRAPGRMARGALRFPSRRFEFEQAGRRIETLLPAAQRSRASVSDLSTIRACVALPRRAARFS